MLQWLLKRNMCIYSLQIYCSYSIVFWIKKLMHSFSRNFVTFILSSPKQNKLFRMWHSPRFQLNSKQNILPPCSVRSHSPENDVLYIGEEHSLLLSNNIFQIYDKLDSIVLSIPIFFFGKPISLFTFIEFALCCFNILLQIKSFLVQSF